MILNCIDRMKFCMENGSNDWDAHLQADMAFHTSVINANDNIYIRKCWELIASQYKMAMYIIRALYAKAFLGTYQEHQRIYEQLMEGNTQPWIAHLENLKADVDKIIREGTDSLSANCFPRKCGSYRGIQSGRALCAMAEGGIAAMLERGNFLLLIVDI